MLSHSNTDEYQDSQPKNVDADSLAKLLLLNSCYEAMPTSGRVVVLDEGLAMWKAFRQIVIQATRHVLLYNMEHDDVITGVLSITDFIRVIMKLLRDESFAVREETNDLGLLTVRGYRELVRKAGKLKHLVWISAEESLLEAVKLLSKHHVHRLPVIDPVSLDPLYMLTYKRIIKFLWCYGRSLFQNDHLSKTPKELDIGTWEGIRVVYPDTSLLECLEVLLNLDVSGVPVVERKSRRFIDMYSRFDAIGIALESQRLSLKTTVKEALQFKHVCENRSCRVVSVKITETFLTVIKVLIKREVRRVCVVDDDDVIQGVISLSDVMKALVLDPGKYLLSRKIPHRKFSQFSFDFSNLEFYKQAAHENKT